MSDELFNKIPKKKNRERKSLTIYFSRPLFEEFRELCDAKQVSASAAIEQLVRDFLTEQREGSLPATSNDPKVARLLAAIESDPSFLETALSLLKGHEAGRKPPSPSRSRSSG